LGVALSVTILGTAFGSGALPAEWKKQFAQFLFSSSQTELVLVVAGVLLAIDLALLFAGMARFQRAKLVLD
jgi:hypothetical protein